ncbi:Protein FAR1-RELATED SEQUENCE 5 [Abeliophyllum distichum]|uniref:Protein FAR1-RELATED SEQUENCE 5 n=1 Tax=Abeliophyllum distichum TaxID=126358 RepID=A0ABD1QV86_9LAMI
MDETYQMRRKDSVPWICEKNRGHTRCGCNARFSVVKQQSVGMVVRKFVEEYNHALTTPSRVHLLRSHRDVSTTKKALMQQFSEANIPTFQQIRLMEIDVGGLSSLGCVERDIGNYESKARQEMPGHDAEILIEYFAFEKEKNPNFFFDYETDEENKFVRCFWAKCESRSSYAYFGDVVVFDTTYNTKKYSMIFAPFVGVNHQGQTIIFGCGLLSDETTKSFVWLFSKFIEAMPTQAAPRVIITDQATAISKASELVDDASLTDARSTFLLGEFQSLRIRVKDIDSGGDIGMSRNKTREETQVVRDPDPFRAKGHGKRPKSRKEKVLSQSSRQCRACGNSGHDKRTCPTLQNKLDNTLLLQYPQNASDPQYPYDVPNPQYSYDMSDDRFTSIDNSNYDAAARFFSNQYPFP